KYLEGLLACWQRPDWAQRSLARWGALCADAGAGAAASLSSSRWIWLRPRQREAFALAGKALALLWGPPGTGKTTTLGALLAEFLLSRPRQRILLLSSTNIAVDQALIAVDQCLERAACASSATPRSDCVRLGSGFRASSYEGRRHLLPTTD